jgi:hypothetical protein
MLKRIFYSQWKLNCETPYIYYTQVTFFVIPRQCPLLLFGNGRLEALCSVGSEEDKAMGCGMLSVNRRDKKLSVNFLWAVSVILCFQDCIIAKFL